MKDPLGPRYWLAPTTRAIVALAVTLAITFAPGQYSPEVGYVVVGTFCLASGAVFVISSLLLVPRGPLFWLFATCGAVLVIAAIISLVSYGEPLSVLLVLTSSTFAATGTIELIAGLTNRKSSPSRDWIFTGALGALFGVLLVLVPADFSLHYTGPDHVERTLTASVILVGSFGAYAAILGVYLLIAGLSLKWSRQRAIEGK